MDSLLKRTETLLKELHDKNPTYEDFNSARDYCFFCGSHIPHGKNYSNPEVHDATCNYIAIGKLVEEFDKLEEA